MCGILCCITSTNSKHFFSSNADENGVPDDPETETGQVQVVHNFCPICNVRKTVELQLLNQLLRNRGPDISFEQCVQLSQSSSNSNSSFQIHLAGHVLWTQGPKPIKQPFTSQDSSTFLLFNGDIYSFGDDKLRDPNSEDVLNHQETNFTGNDGQKLFNILSSCTASTDQTQHFIDVITKLQGPFTFIFYDHRNGQIWFCRDFFGRESLLISVVDNCSLILSSISTFPNSLEVPSSGLYCYNISKSEIKLYSWNCHHERKQITERTNQFCEYLNQVGVRVEIVTGTRIDIGKDLTTKLKQPPADSESNNAILKQLMAIDTSDLKHALQLATEILDDKINELLAHLRRSIRRRIFSKPPLCKNCILNPKINCDRNSCQHSKIGILFSGGLDSMVLTYLTAEILISVFNHGPEDEKSIDLINVAFFQDEDFKLINDSSCDNQKLLAKSKIAIPPDRQTGLESFKVLKQIFEPLGINFNFIPVNVSKSRVKLVRETVLRHLISPLTSVLDDSVGCCLWFASEATSNGLSGVRILLLGSGADEIFGGYGRHRSAFESNGWTGLMSEMQLEIDRISMRNMGRDNRVISDRSVAPRLPFLDENVVRFVTQECDIWEKCFPLKSFTNANHSLGDKILLRTTAVKLLNSQNCDNVHLALFPKRAMQFGSRIAKLENSKEKGGDQCQRLQNDNSK